MRSDSRPDLHEMLGEDEIRALGELSRHATWCASAQGSLTHVNAWWCALTGLSFEQSLGAGWTRALAPRHRQAVLHRLAGAVARGEAYEIELPLACADGRLRWHLARGMPLKDVGGTVTRWVGVAYDIHDSVEAREAAAAGRAYLQAIIDGTPAVVFVKDRAGRYEFVNEAYLQLFGLGRGQVIGRTDAELFPPELAAELRENDLRCWGHGGREAFEESATLPSGRRHFRSEKFLLRDSGGSPFALCGISMEVTDLRQAQDELREQAELLRLSFDAIFVWSIGGPIERWNLGAERLYGFTAQEALGRRSHELLQTRFPVPLPEIKATLRAEGVWTGELKHRTKDGRQVTVLARLQSVPGRKGVHRVLEINRDITGMHAAHEALAQREQELQQSQLRLTVALEAGRMGVWDWTPGAPHAYWNPQMFALLGLPHREDGRGDVETLLRMVHPEDRTALDAEVARALSGGSDYVLEFRVVRGDGQTRWLAGRGRVLQDSQGHPMRMVGVNHDITERKLAEQALREMDARRNEFLAMLAHELRNPLAPITNAVRLLERDCDTREPREAALQIIKRQSMHLTRLVDDLLEVSRITQGRIELRMENVLLATAVLQAVETVRHAARQRGQHLSIDVPPAIDVVADGARLTQIVSNLMVNAVKYTQEGGTISVAASAGPDWVEIRVSDNGPGIPQELLPRLFELFAQGERTIDRSQGGLGIGLAVVRQLATMHGGSVEASSPGLGRGSTFTVKLPRRGRRMQARSSAASRPGMRVAPLPILVVDDNRDAAETLAMLLEFDGHRVRLAFDGEQAITEALGFAPRVVLLDLGLPKLDGFSVARALRADPALADATLVAVSGYGQASDREATAAAGFDAHLVKPVELGAVYEAIERGRRPG